MKLQSNKATAATIVTAAAACLFMSSCEGRKMSNMTPTGDTVEVTISETDSTPLTDSSSNPDTLPKQ